jgi:hypothetical protein
MRNDFTQIVKSLLAAKKWRPRRGAQERQAEDSRPWRKSVCIRKRAIRVPHHQHCFGGLSDTRDRNEE